MFESLYRVHLYWSVCLSVQLIKCQGHVREPEIKPQECNHANRVYFLRTIDLYALIHKNASKQITSRQFTI